MFSSETCDSCATAVERARGLASADVAVQEVEVTARGDLHRRYNVEAVPTLLVADRQGVVRASIVGPPGLDELESALGDLTKPLQT